MNRTTLMHVLHSQLGRHLKSNLEADIWPPGDDMQSRSMCLPIIYLFLPSLPLLHVHDGVKGKKLTHITHHISQLHEGAKRRKSTKWQETS